ncbi:MAG: CotH kinase family protein [Acidimicrobiales bacterium]|nr:CotH kinase family protein [Acidimicrobiales bacterium]
MPIRTCARVGAAALTLALVAATCADDSTSADPEPSVTPRETTTSTTVPPGAGSENPPPEPAWQTGDSAFLFDQDELHTFELTLDDEALAFLDADPVAEEYVEGSLTFNGETLDRVGIRYKGSIGAFFGCVSEVNFSNLTAIGGHKTCRKLSMKVKVNWDGQDRTFYDVRKLQFHAMSNDQSLMHERLGYQLFRDMGIAAPRAVHARLVLNGEEIGVFVLVEQIDGRFTRENFADGTGNLYKEVWPIVGDQIANDRQLFAGLKTNENEDPRYDQIQSFAQAIRDADDEDRGAQLARFMDIDEVARYTAVDRTIRNDDGVFHVYCFDGPDAACAPHNYYWYEEPTAGTMHLIPWDLDHAFGSIISPQNPVIPIPDELGEISNDCEPFGGFGPFMQVSAACDPILGAIASFDEEIDAKVAEFLAGPFALDRVNGLLDAWADQIRDAVEKEADDHTDALRVSTWETSLEWLREQIAWVHEQAEIG